MEEEVQNSRVFSLDEVAEALDVSTTAIQQWIHEGRFLGVQRETCNVMPANTAFRLQDGSVISLLELVRQYSESGRSFADDDEKALLEIEIQALRDKYQSEFEEVYATVQTPEAESDASRWHFYLRRYKDLQSRG
ncbi:hypothetical protein J19TS2_49160 [Cohnella xylanilytica]|uniref:DNA-binding protein Rv2175c wHTH domain-containing protein n=1 Tax=Cohnella xylanilytica TaxID=557555 RepID=A0A841TRL1_9BACL|nr:hypothetical protein [Cohnella xylanilytica]MBB6691037.1 hypothetical protein [Cohnella xylanilytica]GIO15361.1 hypothetical protein J19TS2_49160 [Cohnella xylanilytica]